jgi:hypothetical protein
MLQPQKGERKQCTMKSFVVKRKTDGLFQYIYNGKWLCPLRMDWNQLQWWRTRNNTTYSIMNHKSDYVAINKQIYTKRNKKVISKRKKKEHS